jgi:hypothetical protein
LALTDALGNLVRFVLLPGNRYDTVGVAPLKRFAKNLTHGFSRNAVLRSIVARVPPFAGASG